MNNILNNITSNWILALLMLLLGLILGWLLSRGKKQTGDLSLEGEGALRAEADGLRSRVKELEGRVSTRDGEVSGLKGKLAAATAGAVTAGAAVAATTGGDDDETYALEWRNRYLAARVKYLEGRLSEAPKAKAKPAARKKPAVKKAAPKKKLAAKKKPVAKKKPAVKKTLAAKKKPMAKKAAAPKVLYKDGPTDGPKDDLKLISGIGPKFEKDLNGKGIYYFRQIGNWKAKDVTMVEGAIDSIPGRIKRDEWVKQARGLAKGGAIKKPAPKKATSKKKPGPKPGTKRGSLTAAGKPRQKPGPKATGSKKASKGTDMDKYYANVKKFHASANRGTVENIVKYCGIALRSRDASLVACSDETEVKTVAKNFVTKKLGIKTGQVDLVKATCQEMKSQRFKNRVTFYYLTAKRAGKLDVFK